MTTPPAAPNLESAPLRLRLDATSLSQAVRLLLEAMGLRGADVPIVFHARGAGFEAEVELAARRSGQASPVPPMAVSMAVAYSRAVQGALLVANGNVELAAELLQVDVRTLRTVAGAEPP